MRKTWFLVVLLMVCAALTAFAATGPPNVQPAEPAVVILNSDLDSSVSAATIAVVPMSVMFSPARNQSAAHMTLLMTSTTKPDGFATIGMNERNGGAATSASTRSLYALLVYRLNGSARPVAKPLRI